MNTETLPPDGPRNEHGHLYPPLPPEGHQTHNPDGTPRYWNTHLLAYTNQTHETYCCTQYGLPCCCTLQTPRYHQHHNPNRKEEETRTDTCPLSGRRGFRAYAGEFLALGFGLAVWVGVLYGLLVFAGVFR